MTDADSEGQQRSTYTWSAGRYPSLAPNFLPAIARVVSAAGIDPGTGCSTSVVARGTPR